MCASQPLIGPTWPRSCEGHATDAAVAPAAERYLTPDEYALIVRKTRRWLEDHCAPRCKDPIHHSRVGGTLLFSRSDRAANERLFARGPLPEASLLDDPAEFAAAVDSVRRMRRAQGG